MRSQRILLYGVGIAVCAIAATLISVHGGRGSGIGPSDGNVRPSFASANDGGLAKPDPSIKTESVVQETGLDNAPLALGGAADARPKQLTLEESLQKSAEEYEQGRREEKVAENTRLVATGFSPERLEELQRRKDQLRAQLQQKVYERGQQGLPPTVFSYAATVDPDLLVQDEMSDSEYMNYRRAKGLPTDVRVMKVLAGSNAETAGLQPGDQITKFNGKRVFDSRVLDLSAISDESATGSGVIEVVRNGLPMTLTLPKGPVGIDGSEVNQPSFRNRLAQGR